MTHYYLYRVTNKVNGKIYVGVHKTQRLDDGYMGSGKVIRSAIEKHGLENFEKEILETFDNAADMFKREAEVVTEEFLARDDVYNLRRGGSGGFDYINSSKFLNPTHTKSHMSRMGIISALRVSEGTKKKRSHTLSETHKKGKIKYNTFTGRHHSECSKMMIGAANSQRQMGKGNSQYGSFWITDGKINAKTKGQIPDGWRRGRTMGL